MKPVLFVLAAIGVFVAITHLHAVFTILFVLGLAASGFLIRQSMGDSANSHCNYEAGAAILAVGSCALTVVFGLLAWIS